LLQATKQTKFAFDAQESRKQNKNTVKRKEKKEEYIIQKVKRFSITIGELCIFLCRTEFYLQSN
jgi:hypothetical protein